MCLQAHAPPSPQRNSHYFTTTPSKKIKKPDTANVPKIISPKDAAIGQACEELLPTHGQEDASVLTALAEGADAETHVRQLCPMAPRG